MNNLKLEELNVFVAMHDVKVIGIAESWLHDSIESCEVSIANFTMYRRDRSESKAGRGGGVLL